MHHISMAAEERLFAIDGGGVSCVLMGVWVWVFKGCSQHIQSISMLGMNQWLEGVKSVK